MEKLRVPKTYFLQQISADVIADLGDQTLQTYNDFMKLGVIGFDYTGNVIFQEFNITPSGNNDFIVNLGLQGAIAVDTGTGEDVLAGVYKGIRPTSNDPYTEDTLEFDAPDAQDRIDIIQARVVLQDDPDFSESVLKLDINLDPPAEVLVPEIVRRVQEVELAIKKGTPGVSPVAPAADAGWMTIREVTVDNGATELFAGDIIATTVDPAITPWTTAHDTRIFPAIYNVWAELGFLTSLKNNIQTSFVDSINDLFNADVQVNTQAEFEALFTQVSSAGEVTTIKFNDGLTKVVLAAGTYDLTPLVQGGDFRLVVQSNNLLTLRGQNEESVPVIDVDDFSVSFDLASDNMVVEFIKITIEPFYFFI